MKAQPPFRENIRQTHFSVNLPLQLFCDSCNAVNHNSVGFFHSSILCSVTVNFHSATNADWCALGEQCDLSSNVTEAGKYEVVSELTRFFALDTDGTECVRCAVLRDAGLCAISGKSC